MPKRHRSHQLESESRVAFRSLLPSTWVVRDLDQDYGIDAQVEIFDESGEATGLTFLVQLKATDSLKLKDPPHGAGFTPAKVPRAKTGRQTEPCNGEAKVPIIPFGRSDYPQPGTKYRTSAKRRPALYFRSDHMAVRPQPHHRRQDSNLAGLVAAAVPPAL